MGLPHYVTSKISMSNYEPVYQNLFEVLLTFPAAVTGEPIDLFLEEITKVTGLNVDQVPPAGTEQTYHGAKRTFADALPPSTIVDIGLDVQVNLNEANSMFAYKSLKKWTDLIWNPLTGTRQLKKDYIGGPLIVSLANKPGDVTRQYTFPTVWPTSTIPAIDLDYTSGTTIWSLGTVTFRSDYWLDDSV